MAAEKKLDLNEPNEPGASYEEPVGITKPNVSMTKSPTPKGTSYNKNAVLMILFAILLAFVIVIFLSLPSKKSGNSQATAPEDKAKTFNNQGQDLTPAEFGKIPGSYGKSSDNGKTSIEQPGLPDQSGQLNSNLNNKDTRRDHNDDSYSIPVPPQVQPIPVQDQYSVTGSNSEQQEETAARKSQLRFGGNNPPTTVNNPPKTDEAATSELNKVANQLVSQFGNQLSPVSQQENDQNQQDEKRSFNSQNGSKPFYASSVLTPPLSPYEIKAGSIVPVVLITGLNSDLPGNIIAQVRENVYDTVSGKYLLIPQGSKVIGVYDSKVAYAQSRALVNWTRLIFPNGYSLDLQNLSGVDQSGYTGLKDKVNNHTGKLIMGIFLTSILGAGAEMSQGATSNSVNPSYGQLAAQGAAQNLSNAGQQITEKNLNVQPTIEISPGFEFNLFIDKDFVLQPYK